MPKAYLSHGERQALARRADYQQRVWKKLWITVLINRGLLTVAGQGGAGRWISTRLSDLIHMVFNTYAAGNIINLSFLPLSAVFVDNMRIVLQHRLLMLNQCVENPLHDVNIVKCKKKAEKFCTNPRHIIGNHSVFSKKKKGMNKYNESGISVF